MLNQVTLVGRLAREPELKTLESGKKVCEITLAVPRNYKNEKGEYETDFIDCTLWNSVAQNTVDYCQVGDIVGVHGKVHMYKYVKDEHTYSAMKVNTERVTFLSQSRENKEKKAEEQER